MLDMPSVFGSKIARFLGVLVSMRMLIKPAHEAAEPGGSLLLLPNSDHPRLSTVLYNYTTPSPRLRAVPVREFISPIERALQSSLYMQHALRYVQYERSQ
jgi:hypothetical protein